jgi:hypothetical protein
VFTDSVTPVSIPATVPIINPRPRRRRPQPATTADFVSICRQQMDQTSDSRRKESLAAIAQHLLRARQRALVKGAAK